MARVVFLPNRVRAAGTYTFVATLPSSVERFSALINSVTFTDVNTVLALDVEASPDAGLTWYPVASVVWRGGTLTGRAAEIGRYVWFDLLSEQGKRIRVHATLSDTLEFGMTGDIS